MLTFKRFLIIATALLVLPFMVLAQSRPGLASPDDNEMSVEQSYLQGSVELMIIREQSRAPSRDMKLIALEYINDAIDRGNKSDDIRAALEYLSLEGVLNRTTENGRLVNNFPDIRIKAATALGKLGTPEAKEVLKKMAYGDNEPSVVAEAIKSLGAIGTNNNNDATQIIYWAVDRFNVLNPDNAIAFNALEAFSRIAAANNGLKDRNAIDTIVKISEGIYVPVVRNRAKELLEELKKYN